MRNLNIIHNALIHRELPPPITSYSVKSSAHFHTIHNLLHRATASCGSLAVCLSFLLLASPLLLTQLGRAPFI